MSNIIVSTYITEFKDSVCQTFCTGNWRRCSRLDCPVARLNTSNMGSVRIKDIIDLKPKKPQRHSSVWLQ